MSDFISQLKEERLHRRALLRGGLIGLGAVGTGVLAGCGGGTSAGPIGSGARGSNDVAVLNFALNLEYLEAEYYARATTGVGLGAGDTSGSGGQTTGTVTGGSAVPFSTPLYKSFALEIAADELAHVRLLRSALGAAAVAEPSINLSTSFGAAAQAAGLPNTFNPFADETSFLLGAFIFEDVGVTAYHGAAPLISSPSTLSTAAGILGVEAYHAGGIRTLLTQIGGTAITAASAIAALRARLDGTGSDDVGLTTATGSSPTTIVDADSNAVAFSRTTSQVLSIVYGSGTPGTSSGLFFPNGMNGTIKTV